MLHCQDSLILYLEVCIDFSKKREHPPCSIATAPPVGRFWLKGVGELAWPFSVALVTLIQIDSSKRP